MKFIEEQRDSLHLSLFDCDNASREYQMPNLRKEDFFPNSIIDFQKSISSHAYSNWVHFYLDDYRIERFWNRPERYLPLLTRFAGVFTPDFSLYVDMPTPMKIWNVYRSRLLGQRMQYAGIHVIPTISWADEDSFRYCFDGIAYSSIVTISTVGIKSHPAAKKLFLQGFEAMIDRINPEKIIIYGEILTEMPQNFSYILFDSQYPIGKKGKKC